MGRFFVLTIMLLILLTAAGCSFLKAELPYLTDEGTVAEDENGGAGGEDGFLLGQDDTMVMSEPTETIDVVLYFGDEEGNLVAEKRTIPKVEGIGRATIKELIEGPEPAGGLYATIPLGTRLRDINVKDDGTAIVDFSGDIRAEHWGGYLGEILTVYSIVNTLAQFPTVDRVQILVDGQKLDTLVEHVDIREPLEPNNNLVKAASSSQN